MESLFSSQSKQIVLDALWKLNRESGVRELSYLTGLRSRAVEQALSSFEESGVVESLTGGRRILRLPDEFRPAVRKALDAIEEVRRVARQRLVQNFAEEVFALADAGRRLHDEGSK